MHSECKNESEKPMKDTAVDATGATNAVGKEESTRQIVLFCVTPMKPKIRFCWQLRLIAIDANYPFCKRVCWGGWCPDVYLNVHRRVQSVYAMLTDPFGRNGAFYAITAVLVD